MNLPFLLLSGLAAGLFVYGVRSLRTLQQLADSNDDQHRGGNGDANDPLAMPSSVTLLFSTADRGPQFRRRQKGTIWLFCAAILLLFVIRMTFWPALPEVSGPEAGEPEATLDHKATHDGR